MIRRVACFFFGCWIACPGLPAQETPLPAKGSQVMVVVETPLISAGRTLRTAEAGAQFEVLATNATQQQVFVSVPTTGGARVVASLPLSSVVVVDGGAAPGQTPGQNPGTSAPVASAPPAAGPPQPDASGAYAAIDVARFFKQDRAAANAHFNGKPLKVRGSVERAEVRVGSDAPVVIFGTAQGLPKIKLEVHPSVSRDREFYRGASAISWYYDGWYSLGHKLEFRPSGNGLQARFKYKRTHSYSTGGTYTYRATSDWFAILTPGDVLTASGTCKGMLMDVIVEAAELSRPAS